MKYRKLRIAWSVAWGILCLLLVGLWVRSRTTMDFLNIRLSTTRDASVGSAAGNCTFAIYFNTHSKPWSISHLDLSEIRQSAAELNQFWDRAATHRLSNVGRILKTSPNTWTVHLSQWIVVTMFASLAAAPWLRWRFSLRTLLIGMTVAAIGLGAIVYLLRN